MRWPRRWAAADGERLRHALQQLFVARKPPGEAGAQDVLIRALQVGGGIARPGLPVTPEEAAKVLELLRSGAFFSDAAGTTSAVVAAHACAPAALMRDIPRTPSRLDELGEALVRDGADGFGHISAARGRSPGRPARPAAEPADQHAAMAVRERGGRGDGGDGAADHRARQRDRAARHPHLRARPRHPADPRRARRPPRRPSTRRIPISVPRWRPACRPWPRSTAASGACSTCYGACVSDQPSRSSRPKPGHRLADARQSAARARDTPGCC